MSPPRQRSRDVNRIQELNVNKREIHLIEVKYCEDTRPGHQLEASKKQHEVLCKRLKAKKIILNTSLLGVGGSIYTSHTLNHLKELGLDTHEAHKTAFKLHAHSVLNAHKLTTTRRVLEKSSCFQGLGLEQGLLVTLQILTSSSFSLLGQCVSLSFIDVRSGFTAYAALLILFFLDIGSKDCLASLNLQIPVGSTNRTTLNDFFPWAQALAWQVQL